MQRTYGLTCCASAHYLPCLLKTCACLGAPALVVLLVVAVVVAAAEAPGWWLLVGLDVAGDVVDLVAGVVVVMAARGAAAAGRST